MFIIFLLLLHSIFIKALDSPRGKTIISSLNADYLYNLDRTIMEDMILDTAGIVKKNKYPIETHKVSTDDGYLLTMHRIPSKPKKTNSRLQGTPVLLMHGLLSSSVDWVINGPGKSLAYLLADKGYDVWMGNARGNYYSRNHNFLNPDYDEFWDFSWNEIGYYDLPAMIDYMIKKTNRTKLHYIGHSQGTTSFFVMGANRQKYNKHIISMHALAPVAYMTHAVSPILTFMAPFLDTLGFINDWFGQNEFSPTSTTKSYFAELICGEDSMLSVLCSNFVFMIHGYNPDQLNKTMLPVYMSQTPGGASTKQLIHYAQEYVSGEFRQYDYGIFENIFSYDNIDPPNYQLKNVIAPIALHYGENDWLSSPVDVLRLNRELPNVINLIKIPSRTFNHVDFLWGIDAKTLVYEKLLKIVDKYTTKT